MNEFVTAQTVLLMILKDVLHTEKEKDNEHHERT